MTLDQRSGAFRALRRDMSYWAQHDPDPVYRERIKRWLDLTDSAQDDVLDWVAEAKNIGVRLPDFDGDLMGRPADDFADNDDPDYWDRLRRKYEDEEDDNQDDA